jgi:hypothetical protein
MAINSAEVSTGKPKITGAIYYAPEGTTLPEDATSELDNAFANLGYVSEDGVTNANSIESENVKAWGGDIVQSSQTEKTDTFQLTLIQSINADVLKANYGADNVSGTLATGIVVKANAKELQAACWVIDMILTDNTLKRVVIPRGKISELGEVVYNDTDPIGYQPTINALPDGDGNTHYEYIQAGTISA